MALPAFISAPTLALCRLLQESRAASPLGHGRGPQRLAQAGSPLLQHPSPPFIL